MATEEPLPEFSAREWKRIKMAVIEERMKRNKKEFQKTLDSCRTKRAHRLLKSGNPKRMFSVTTIAADPGFGGKSTPVICRSFKKAKWYIETNAGDLWEHSYMLAVIEAVVPDRLYEFTNEQYWYRWNLKKGKYEPIHRPKVYENIVGFGVG